MAAGAAISIRYMQTRDLIFLGLRFTQATLAKADASIAYPQARILLLMAAGAAIVIREYVV